MVLLAGLDIETTGLNIHAGHRLIQIGISIWDTETGDTHDFCSDVNPVGKVLIDKEALKVNGFTNRRINKAPSSTCIDTQIWQQIMKCGYKHDSLIPVGWNVINFDMPFIRRELPLIAGLFTYPNEKRSTRAIDLMPICFLIAYQKGLTYDQVKSEAREEVAKRLGENNEHDAMYDAKAAIETFRLFNEMMEIKI